MSDTKHTIRKASESDSEAIAGLFLEYGNPNGEDQDAAAVRRTTCELLSACLHDSAHMVYVVTNSDEVVVGYCSVHLVPFAWLQGTEAYVSELLVAEAARGLGIGSMLLQRVESDARAHGCFRIMLNNTKSKASYERQFYGKTGFVERDGIANFIKDLRNS